MSLKAPRASPSKPIVFPPHEKAATLDDVREEVRALSNDLGEKFLALTSMLGGISKRLKTLEKRRK